MDSGALRGRVAVVTGASSGIGAAVVHALDVEGARVALAARREETLREVRSTLNGETLVVATDVTDRAQVRAMVERAEAELGLVDILVNCAGIMYYTLVSFPTYTLA